MQAQPSEAAIIAAVITAGASLAVSLFNIAHNILGAPLKYWLEKKALRNKLETEYEYEERKKLRNLISMYRGRMLNAAESLKNRIWNLYANEQAGWLNVRGRDDQDAYYFRTWIYRFLHVLALSRRFEAQAVFIDPKIAQETDEQFVKFMKAFTWAACAVALFEDRTLAYNADFEKDHFFRDNLRRICDACTHENGEFVSQEELNERLNDRAGFHSILQFFDGLCSTEPRLRWDRIVCLHLLLMAFLNTFGYQEQRSSSEEFIEAAGKIQHTTVRTNLQAWLPRLGLAGASKPIREALALCATEKDAIVRKAHA